MSNQHELEQTTTVPIRRRVALSGHLSAPEHTSQPPPVVATPPPRAAFPLVLVSTRPADHYTYEPQMNDMLSGGPAPSGRSALEQMDETNHPVEASDGDDEAVTVTRSVMATDPAAEGEAGDAKV
jgi:hypothetical protein